MRQRQEIQKMPRAGGVNRFFVIDGIDGAGKSTQAALLAESLEREGRSVARVRDPGGTKLSDRIREILLQPDHLPAPAAELCLYAAARAQLVREVIIPALEAGAVVVADRFTWSTYAYQGMGRGLPRHHIEQLEAIACVGTKPGHVFVLDLPAESRAGRLRQKGGMPDRLESESDAFFTRVREAFLTRAHEHPHSSSVIDATQTPAIVHAAIAAKVRELLTA